MAKRDETTRRKVALLNDLREAHSLNDDRRPQTPLSQRELGTRYGLSGQTVSLLLQQLMQEGVLYTVPRMGTFLGRSPAQARGLYVFVTRIARQNLSFEKHIEAIQDGFAEHIAQVGGATCTLSPDEMSWHLEEGDLDDLAGVFLYDINDSLTSQLLSQSGIPGVAFGENSLTQSEKLLIGTVDFDNEEGGAQATRHLMDLGHRDIAFLGLHSAIRPSPELDWSVRRHQGWNRVLQSTGQDTKKLSFLPTVSSCLEHKAQVATGHSAAIPMLPAIEKKRVTAVIAANLLAAEGLLQALESSAISRENWPAIVCFDEAPQGSFIGFSYLRLPWEKLGAEAAQLLWEYGRMPSTKGLQRRYVKMNLVPRLTCRREWATSGLAQRQVIQARTARPHLADRIPQKATL